MKLASKLFLASALVIAVLLAVGILSLRAIADLVAANRAISTRAVPAVRLASSAHDVMRGLARLEMSFLVLRDARYAALWDEQAARTHEDLGSLTGLLTTPPEQALLAEAQGTFDRYRAVVFEERKLLATGQRQRAIRLAETEGRRLTQRVERSLAGLLEATHGAALRAQTEAARLERRTWTGVVVALTVAVVLALFATGLLARRLTRRLDALSAATAAVADGAFSEPIREEGRDELAALAHSFNAMAVRLRQLDELKEGFLATVSHELRSPLTSMREAAHLLREEVPGGLNPKQARLVGIIEQSTERLLRLVNQVLDFSRLRAGMMPMARERVDLERAAGRAVAELKPQAEERGVMLEIDRVGRRFAALGDEDKLMQVVVNLLTNSIRFTPRGGQITVRLVDAGPEVEIQVEDTGSGIPTDALPHIFDMYQQAHPRRGGTGLGLAIVRGVVEAHGGRVIVESQEGKGSRFTVLLPRGTVDA